ncbi:MAG: cation-translocating P-type ATPase [Opitutales bacterium]|nr:cation-translocating P-type ATPase [Opitutales bacterium]
MTTSGDTTLDPSLPVTELACACHGSDEQPAEPRDRFVFKLAICLALAGQGMVVGLGYNNARLAGEGPTPFGAAYWGIHGFLIFTVVVALLLFGRTLLVETWNNLSRGRISVESLFMLSLLGAFTGSVIATATAAASVYYEVVVVVLLIYSLGKWMGRIQRDKARGAVSSLRSVFSVASRIQTDGASERVSVNRIRIGEQIQVQPGEPIPLDGRILIGEAYIRETALTGELNPVSRAAGDAVQAGSWSVDGDLRIEVGRDQSGRRALDRMLEMVESARQSPSQLQQQADRIMVWFVPLVALVSLATLLFWLWLQPIWWVALFNSMAVLLVACPCALGLAMPVGLARGLYALSQLGIHSRSGRLLDALATTDRIVFDKTGTLSEEELEARTVHFSADWQARQRELLDTLASLEGISQHPVARALAKLRKGPRKEVEEFHEFPGKGVEGRVEGLRIRAGEPSWFGAETRDWMQSRTTTNSGGKGKKQILVSVNDQPAALVLLEEAWRSDTLSALEELKQLGIRCDVLTGDPQQAAGLPAGLPIESGLLPEAKAERVRSWKTEHPRLVYVGDGINDAAAMAEAPVSIAMANAAPLTQSTSDALLMGAKLEPLILGIRQSRKIRNRLQGNMTYALIYNVFGMGLAAAGMLHPVVAALIMVVSSAWVSWRALNVH